MRATDLRAGLVGGAALGALLLALPALAMPRLMDLYNEHPRSLPEQRDKCVVCHVHADGSGELTAFGGKYERAGLQFSEALMAEYGNLFVPAAGRAASAQPPPAASTAAGAPGPAATPVEDWNVARFYREECNKCHGKYGDGDPLQGVPAFATRQWIQERMPRTDELLAILLKGKDKMVGMEGKLTETQVRELLEHVKSIAVQYGS